MGRILTNEPNTLSVAADKIPGLLKSLDQWVVWDGNEKANGGLSKAPVSPTTRRPINAQDPANWLPFADAVAAYKDGVGKGIGIVLNGEPVAHDKGGAPLFLVGVDLDNVRTSDIDPTTVRILKALKGAYLEVSPSGRGLRLFALSREKPRSGQGTGGELYAEKRFLTVTGREAQGSIGERTEGVRSVQRLLWPERADVPENVVRFPEHRYDINRTLTGDQWVETPENVRRIEEVLSYIPPNSAYEVWRGCIWALASLGWEAGPDIAGAWSSKSKEHWERDGGAEARSAIDKLFQEYRPDRGVTVGTLLHHAYDHGMPRPERPIKPLFAMSEEPRLRDSERFRLLTRDEVDRVPPLNWTIPGILPERGLGAIFGEPGSGKSFLALDLAARISNGTMRWFGRQVQRRDVVYIALEGGAGIKLRLAAWDQLNSSRAPDLKFGLWDLSLLVSEQVDALMRVIATNCAPGTVVIVDTLAQATAGGDENSAQDMGVALKALQTIAAACQGFVLLVHHSGKDASRGMRGHSVLNAAMDVVIAVERDRTTGRRNWRVTKMKDADDGAAGMFTLELFDLGPDAFGGRLTSCAVKDLVGAAASAAAQPAPRGTNQAAVLEALRTNPERDNGWHLSSLIGVAKVALADTHSRHRATRAKTAVDGLIGGGLLKKNEGGMFTLTPVTPDHLPPSPHKGGRGGAVV